MSNIIGGIKVRKIEYYDESEIIDDFKDNVIIRINGEILNNQEDYKNISNLNEMGDNIIIEQNFDNIEKNITKDQVDPNDFFNSGYNTIKNIISNTKI